jgi:transcription-repair coupling factor (superfamily II helicase)
MARADARPDLSVTSRLLERFIAWPAHAKVLIDLRGGAEHVRIRGLTGSTRSLAAAGLALERGAPIVFLTAESNAAEEIREDIDFLLGGRSAILLPDPGSDHYVAQPQRSPLRSLQTEILCALALGSHAALPLYRDLRVLVMTPGAWLRRVPSPEWLRGKIRLLRVGETVDPEEIVRGMVDSGYEMTPLVGEYGDASRRGGILDIYTLGRENPVRCEFDGDEIVSLREFDVFSQRSLGTLQEVAVLPSNLFSLTGEERARAAERLTESGVDPNASVVDLLRSGTSFDGAEWLVGFSEIPLAPISAYLPDPLWRIVDDPLAVERALEEIGTQIHRSHAAAVDDGSIVSPPEELYGDPATGRGGVRIDLGGASPLRPESGSSEKLEVAADPESAGLPPAAQEGTIITTDLPTRPAERFGRSIELTQNYIFRLRTTCEEIHILCDTEQHKERLAELLHPVPAEFHVGNLSGGFEIPDIGLALLTDHEIFARTRRRAAPRRFSRGISLKELLAMGPGDYVVHIDHGIGIYRGLTKLLVNGQMTDCMTVEYAGTDKLYIPVDQLHLVQRYAAEEGHRPQLSRIGSPSWARKKAAIKRKIKDMAEELLKSYAIRRSRPGHAFSQDTDAQSALELSFPYDETVDQLTAICDVKRDMQEPSPMDRLICGDVGYGKTEVAIRAAFKAAMDSKQVVVLVPTTLLAQQHYETFSERLRDFPIRVELLSRFRTPGETRSVIVDLKAGKVDIVVGTHKLLGKEVGFRDLGLLVIDEEHRFGVAHKEKLKRLKETVDVLTLTATPIPRTLHFALSGGRDMSTILTPPRDRRPVQTEIVEFRDDVIAHALMREADRGGQAFFVHNRIDSIDTMSVYLSRLVPHLRIAVAHGQMVERQLDAIMHAFLHKEYDILLSTTIIESGLDFPNVNTILVNRGDTFGLAQLYQLRGRVGRSSRKAYCYLLVPPYRTITETAQKRLKAIEEFGDLGSGFQLAMRDLEIRGAGNLLGGEQHGFILEVGFDLYNRLLDEAVRELKGMPSEAKAEARVVTDVEAHFPDSYVPDHREKMNLYKSIADTQDLSTIASIEEEIRDRFGMLPDPGRHLLDLRRVRLMAGEADVETATVRRDLVMFEFRRPLTRGDIKRLAESPVAVEFHTPSHGRHRVHCRKLATAGPVATALVILRSLLAKEIPFEGK